MAVHEDVCARGDVKNGVQMLLLALALECIGIIGITDPGISIRVVIPHKEFEVNFGKRKPPSDGVGTEGEKRGGGGDKMENGKRKGRREMGLGIKRKRIRGKGNGERIK